VCGAALVTSFTILAGLPLLTTIMSSFQDCRLHFMHDGGQKCELHSSIISVPFQLDSLTQFLVTTDMVCSTMPYVGFAMEIIFGILEMLNTM